MKCKEVAVFKFKHDCIDGATELNKNLITEMQNASNESLLNFEIYQSSEDTSLKDQLKVLTSQVLILLGALA